MRRSRGAILIAWVTSSTLAACLSFGDLSGDDTTGTPDSGLSDTTTPSDAQANDASSPSDSGGGDSGPPSCDFAAPFGAPVAFSNNSVHDDWSPRLSPDELFVYFASSRVGYLDASAQIFLATRATTSDHFSLGTEMVNVNGNYVAVHPTVTASGLLVLFQTNATGSNEIYFSTRTTTLADFGAPQPVSNVNAGGSENNAPYVSPDGQVLYFARKPLATPNNEIYRATFGGGGFTGGVLVSEISDPSDNTFPVATPDDLTVYWASTRTDGGIGTYDIWTARRTSTSDTFTDIRDVAELNTVDEDFPSWISSD
ncbi:MAG: TolB family protein, partial [Polyangiaceae bacterium]